MRKRLKGVLWTCMLIVRVWSRQLLDGSEAETRVVMYVCRIVCMQYTMRLMRLPAFTRMCFTLGTSKIET
jgi:hypothetical protein